MRPRSLRWRLLIAFLAPAAGVFALAGAAGYVISRDVLEDELGQSLSAVAAAAAADLNADTLLTIQPGDDRADPPTRIWTRYAEDLERVRAATGARRLAVVDRDGRVRVDAGGGLPVGAEVPELARDRLELSRLFERGERAASQVLFEGVDGELYLTGYAPLANRDGAIVGAVLAEGSASFWRPLRTLLRAYLLFAGATLLVLGAVAVVMGNALTRPLRRLMSAALRIGRGDLQTPVAPERSLEIGTLAHEFDEMRKALDARERQLNLMLAGVAHEVRNPIGGIELFAGLLGEELGPSNAEARAHLDRIRGEIEYLKRIVEDFLAFARDQRIAKGSFDAGAWIQGACELMRAEASPRQVAIEVDAPAAPLEGDENLLRAALVNLVRNAVQASPRGTAVRVRGQLDGGSYLVEVDDSGPGVPAESRERIFEPFFTTREKGTGLGLPLARKIARAHGGDLWLDSASGRTSFRLRIPVR